MRIALCSHPVLRGALLCVLCVIATCAWGQDDLIDTYTSSWSSSHAMLLSIICSVAYLLLYTGTAIITLSYLRVFNGFDLLIALWVLALWGGGMVVNQVLFKLTGTGHTFFTALLAMPVLYGWSYFISTRSWADITPENARRVALAIALICAPYFGPSIVTPPHRPPATNLGQARTPHLATLPVPVRIVSDADASFLLFVIAP